MLMKLGLIVQSQSQNIWSSMVSTYERYRQAKNDQCPCPTITVPSGLPLLSTEVSHSGDPTCYQTIVSQAAGPSRQAYSSNIKSSVGSVGGPRRDNAQSTRRLVRRQNTDQ